MGAVLIPSQKQMKEFNLKVLLDAIDSPKHRYYEENFRNHWQFSGEGQRSWDWSHECKCHISNDYLEFNMRILVRDSFDAKHPLQLGSYKNLNAK